MMTTNTATAGAWFSFRYGRPLRGVLLAFAAVALTAALSTARAPELVQRLMLVAAMVLVFGLTRRIIAGDRTNGRWWILFQRPVTPLAHYSRVTGFAAATIVTALLAVALLLSLVALFTDGSLRMIWGSLAGALVWSVCLLSIGVGVSAVVKEYDFEVLLLLYFLSSLQVFITQQLGLDARISGFVSWLLPPVDSIFMMWNWMVSGVWALTAGDLLQLFVYPAAWLAYAAHRVQSADFGELS